nr:DUF3833 domain-containing protein [Motiliproteus sp. SC1-56]
MTAIALTFLLGCSDMNIRQFEGQQPLFKPETYFQGKTWAWGVFEDRFGNLKRQFQAEIQGDWDGQTLTLDEHFVYSDGETEQRIWRIVRGDDNLYTGTAGDVVGEARGQTAGNAFQWRYQLNLPVGENHWVVNFNDWLWLQPGGVVVSRTSVTKWGLELGTLTVFFSKRGPAS